MDYERSSCFANRLRADQPDQSHLRIKTLLNVSQLTADERDYDDDDDRDGDDDDGVGDDIDSDGDGDGDGDHGDGEDRLLHLLTFFLDPTQFLRTLITLLPVN